MIRCKVKYRRVTPRKKTGRRLIGQSTLFGEPVEEAGLIADYKEYTRNYVSADYECDDLDSQSRGGVAVDWENNYEGRGPSHCFLGSIKAVPERKGYGSTALAEEFAFMLKEGCTKIYGHPVMGALGFWEKMPFPVTKGIEHWVVDLEGS